MIPIQTLDTPSACRPEWVKLNHLLSYCTRPLLPAGGQADNQALPRCNHQGCLFSATKL